MTYLRNAWYAALWSEMLGQGTVARRMLDEPILFYRDSGGRAVALANRCPHRFAPLDRGIIIGDEVQCGYHGLRFAPDGRCRYSPQTPEAPPAARIRSYPIAERDTILWIWMGHAEDADPGLIPAYPVLNDDREHRTVRGYYRSAGHYQLVIDNLMDLTHPEFVHAGSLGSPDLNRACYEVERAGPRSVRSNRWYTHGASPPAFERFFPTAGRQVEHWVDMLWTAPANLALTVGITLSDTPRSEGRESLSLHLLSPETATHTHYLFSSTRSHSLDSVEQDRRSLETIRHAFEMEDSPMLAAVQANMGTSDLWSLRPLILPGDAGAVRARRLLDKLIREEVALDAGKIPVDQGSI
ncbi:aromatic ring-hydroxylating dioxygenase subunit alpha [Sphingomonas sp.]|uniref:aromatic ring-hydroxylating dioxygenase subunit alpha n=1 Tax=Sphingomonas sp. TaxID=28214 RepID=UPI000DB29775|nr:aromatic ring-hydroxylating dioxygenase subunit alpha [Sphingomonas sp.]PZU10979.1 MAG: vanillate monooxygenase [Sphingomonas sp.]